MAGKKVEVKLLTLSNCKGCREAKRILKEIGLRYRQVTVEDISLEEHPEAAAKYDAMAVPTIIVNGKKVAAGRVSREAIEKAIKGLC